MWLVIAVPHCGGMGGIEQKPRIHAHYMAIAQNDIIILPVPRRVKQLIIEWSPPIQDTAGQQIDAAGPPIHFGAHESGFADREHLTGRHYPMVRN